MCTLFEGGGVEKVCVLYIHLNADTYEAWMALNTWLYYDIYVDELAAGLILTYLHHFLFC